MPCAGSGAAAAPLGWSPGTGASDKEEALQLGEGGERVDGAPCALPSDGGDDGSGDERVRLHLGRSHQGVPA